MTNEKKHLWIQNGNTFYSDVSDGNNYYYLNNEKTDKDKNQVIKKLYESYFKKPFKNVLILAAAGTSCVCNGILAKELWQVCKEPIIELTNKITNLEQEDFYTTPNIEGLLSYINLYIKFNKNNEIEKLKKDIEKKIATACNLTLNNKTHIKFLNKITARKPSDPRIKLFTLNYDLLFEQAANEAGFTIIDGFSFSYPRTFLGKMFDLDIVNREKTRLKNEESFESKVFHLYKMHGSINWYKEEDKIRQKDIKEQNIAENPLLIYPATDKYESSYEQPYFEMMSRFQQAVRKENTLLIVVGFSFQDKHIKNIIVEAVKQNASFNLVIVNYDKNKGYINKEDIREFFTNPDDNQNFQVENNVTIIYSDFKDFAENYPSNNAYNSYSDDEETNIKNEK